MAEPESQPSAEDKYQPQKLVQSRESLDALVHQRSGYEKLAKEQQELFLRASDLLEEFVEQSGQIVSQGQQLLEIATCTGAHEDSFSETQTIASRHIVSLTTYAEESAKMVREVSEYNSAIESLLSLESRLTKTFRPIKLVRMLFLIESAELEPEKRQIFTALSQDIDQLHDAAEELSQTEFARFGEIHGVIANEMSEIEARLERCCVRVARENKHVQHKLQQMNEDIRRNQGVDIRLTRVAQDISAQVSSIVMAIQNQDIAGQKLEHIVKAVDDIAEKSRSWKGVELSEEDRESLGQCLSIARIQFEQLNSVITDFDHTQQTITQGVPQILEQLDQLDEECMQLNQFNVLSHSADGVAQLLLDSMDMVADLLEEVNKQASRAYDSIRPFGDVSSNITDTLRTIARNLRVVTFNAQIKASKVGSGTGLHALTAKVNQISDDTEAISITIGKELDRIAVGLTQVVETFSRLNISGTEQLEEFTQERSKADGAIHALRDEALQSMMLLTASGSSIRDVASRVRDAFSREFGENDYYHKLRSAFRDYIRAIEALGIQASQLATEELQELGQQYTMEEEWDIHRKVLAGEAIEHTAASDKQDSDIEFFDLGGPAEASAAPISNTSDNAIFFDDPAPVEQNKKDQKTQAAPKQEDLGDNVDFF